MYMDDIRHIVDYIVIISFLVSVCRLSCISLHVCAFATVRTVLLLYTCSPKTHFGLFHMNMHSLIKNSEELCDFLNTDNHNFDVYWCSQKYGRAIQPIILTWLQVTVFIMTYQMLVVLEVFEYMLKIPYCIVLLMITKCLVMINVR